MVVRSGWELVFGEIWVGVELKENPAHIHKLPTVE